MARTQTASSQTHVDRENEVRHAEQEIASAEAQLNQELFRLAELEGQLGGKVEHLKAAAAKAHLAGIRDPKLADLQRRWSTSGVPRVDLDAQREQALRARLDAVAARRTAVDLMRQALTTHSGELGRVSSALAADGAALAQLEAQAREQALRQAQQEKASQEARVEAAIPPPRPAAPLAPPALPALFRDPTPTPIVSHAQLPKPAPEARRGMARVRMQATVDLHSDSNFYTGFSSDISGGGLFVATVDAPPIGTEVDLAFGLPGGKRMAVHGVVKWIRVVNDRTPDIFPGAGIQFVNLDAPTAAVIQKFAGSRETMFFPE